MRTVRTEDIIKNIKEMCIEANHFLSEDMRQVFEQSVEAEKSPLGSLVLNQLKENLEIAGKDMIPICQASPFYMCVLSHFHKYDRHTCILADRDHIFACNL